MKNENHSYKLRVVIVTTFYDIMLIDNIFPNINIKDERKNIYLYINWFGIDVKALKHNFNDTPYSQSETRSSANKKNCEGM